LKVGDLVDCYDTSGVWYLSTVLKTNYTAGLQKVFIGYRTYRKDGEKTDPDGRTYRGWSKSFDEWIETFSLRIQPPTSLSHTGYIECKSGDREYDRITVDDKKDILLNSPRGVKIFCVERGDKENQEFVVNLLNNFGIEGGFDKILKRLKERALPFGIFFIERVELLYSYIEILGTIWALFHRKFACEYIPKVKDAVVECLKAIHSTEVRKLERDCLDKIGFHLSNLLRRVYTVFEREKIIDLLELILCTIMLQSDYLQRQIDGLKGLNEMMKKVKRSIMINEKFLLNWIKEHKIIDEIFGKRKHQQILQRSVPIVIFIYEQQLLTADIMEKIWENVKDDQFKDDIFKVIKEAAFPMGSKELNFFITKIAELNPSMVSEEALDVIFEARKGNEKSPKEFIKYSDIMQKITLESSYPLSVSEKALEKYAGMIADLPFEPYKKGILKKCINEMIEKVNLGL